MIYAASSIDERERKILLDEVEVRKAISRNHHKGPFHDSANAFAHAAKSHTFESEIPKTNRNTTNPNHL
jgi:hypothetical protein